MILLQYLKKVVIHINFLFWNLKKNSKSIYCLKDILAENGIDVFILSEVSTRDLIWINQNLLNYKPTLQLPKNRTFLFYKNHHLIKKVKDSHYYSFFEILNTSFEKVLLVTVHFPSRLWKREKEIGYQAQITKRDIVKFETEYRYKHTLVVGDFNLNPFSEEIVSTEGFHAVMSKEIAKKEDRIVDFVKHRYFFNPMWFLHGNINNEVMGSYYYHKNSISYVWNLFDQVLIRPSLIDYFDFEYLNIISSVTGHSLLNKQGQPDSKVYSDHLPIKFRIKFDEKE